jgi:uracil-DNA glycosylase
VERAVPATRCATACVVHVRDLVGASQPRLIVPLGATALRSLRAAFPEQPRLARLRFPASVGHTAVAGGTFIHPLYHVAARARTARPEAQQREDWRALGCLWEWIRSGEPGGLPGQVTDRPTAEAP